MAGIDVPLPAVRGLVVQEMSQVLWVLESHVFPETHGPIREAILRLGHEFVDWDDNWWSEGFPAFDHDIPIVFRGSLGNAALIEEQLDWSPGAFCPTEAFRCSSWYDNAREWLLHSCWSIVAANEFVADPISIGQSIGCAKHVFVRPDSPLKPFSGRVVELANVSLKTLDHGFYYDDETIPIVVAPVRTVGAESRFVVVDQKVIAGSGYDVDSRSANSLAPTLPAWRFATKVAKSITPPAAAYVLDVCECDNKFHLLELNPFGGADLYACDVDVVVNAITKLVD